MNKRFWLVLVLLNITGLIFVQCKDKVVDEDVEADYGLRPATEPQIAIENFKIIYNFAQNGIEVEKALELYRDCFSNDTNGQQYIFKYRDISGNTVSPDYDSLSFVEEMHATATLYRAVNRETLNLSLSDFSIRDTSVEVAADTSVQEIKHPHEDWYVYRVNARLFMNNSDPSRDQYYVQGEEVFYIRRCADGKFRIIRWVDLSFINVSPKTAGSQSHVPVLRQSLWSEVKLLFNL